MNKVTLFFLLFFILTSCKKNQEEINEMNLFLTVNYEFNNRILYQQKEDYYVMIQEQQDKKVEKLNELYLKYELLISDIDKAIVNKENDLEQIFDEYNYIFDEISKIADDNKDDLLSKFSSIDDKNANELYLNIIKNRLVIAMIYAFEYTDKSKFITIGKFPKYVE